MRWGVLFWLLFCVVAVLIRGVRWDETFEHAQVITGQAPYPEGHPLRVYVRGAFSLQTYASAAALALGAGPALVCGARNVLFLLGTVLPVFLLHRLGVRELIVTNAAGGIRRSFRPGDLGLLRDHLNLMGVHPLRGPNPPGYGPRFPDMSEAYSKALRRLAQEAAAETLGRPLAEGVYAAFSGPTYETPAEVRLAERVGADLVGMSTVPEVIAANYLGMRVLGISCVTNMAAGILEQPLDHAEVVETSLRVMPVFTRLLEGILRRLSA